MQSPSNSGVWHHERGVASSLPPLTLVGKHFDRVVRAADPTSEEWAVSLAQHGKYQADGSRNWNCLPGGGFLLCELA